ncbi:MAG: bifunctional UDP-N-acetylglucosamine diphosphorylase/glucosamine-1-phosphate N-acetyltransferase GlmU [Wenzhouxiangellaceae bacterium]
MSHALHIIVDTTELPSLPQSRLPLGLLPLAGEPLLAHVLQSLRALEPASLTILVADSDSILPQRFDADDVKWLLRRRQSREDEVLAQWSQAMAHNDRLLVVPGHLPLLDSADLRWLCADGSGLCLLTETTTDSNTTTAASAETANMQVTVAQEDQAATVTCISVAALRAARRETGEAEPTMMVDWADWAAVLSQTGHSVNTLTARSAASLLAVTDFQQLAVAEAQIQQRRRQQLLRGGVLMPDPGSVQIRGRVSHGVDVRIDSGVVLNGTVELGDAVEIGVGCVLEDAKLAAGTVVAPYSVLQGVTTTGPCQIGPYARLRPGTVLAEGCKVGNFVEVKKTRMGAGSKASHLTYLGDSQIGAGVNIGAGVITCNYDGVNKHVTEIGDGAFIGSNCALVAPVAIGAQALVGAGSTITRVVPDQHLAIGRERQKNIPPGRYRRPEKVTD